MLDVFGGIEAAVARIARGRRRRSGPMVVPTIEGTPSGVGVRMMELISWLQNSSLFLVCEMRGYKITEKQKGTRAVYFYIPKSCLVLPSYSYARPQP